MTTSGWEIRARQHLGETAEIRERALASFRKLLADELGRKPPIRIRKDDEYFLRYLRYSKFDVPRAVKCFINFYSLWGHYPDKIWPLNKAPSDWKFYWSKMLSGVLSRRNFDGTTVMIYRKGLWKPGSDGLVCADALAALFWFLELLLDDPAVQVDGFTLIMDGRGFSWTFLPHLDLSTIKVCQTVRSLFSCDKPSIMPKIHEGILRCARCQMRCHCILSITEYNDKIAVCYVLHKPT